LTDTREVSAVQLQLLDLAIEKENAVVPMDERVRTELIDLMARILVTVFEAQGGKVDESRLVQFQNQAGALSTQSVSGDWRGLVRLNKLRGDLR
jgi:hypothetical protein